MMMMMNTAPPAIFLQHYSLLLALLLVAASSLQFVTAATIQHSFEVKNLTVNRLCQGRVITTVNGQFPGPTIEAQEGDTLVVRVLNSSPYNITIHWHGVFQRLTGWADGAEYATQCPIRPGNSYTYRFNVTGQVGTLWWHSHSQWLRATVYGALIIKPRQRQSYPFPTPAAEHPIVLGEWWNADVVQVENNAVATGGAPNISDAYTFNGLPGDLYPCSQNQMYSLNVEQGKTYLLRIVNAAVNNQLFFKIASHNLTVVAVDAAYTKPYVTDVVLIAPGQTVDALLAATKPTADAAYYMAAAPYISAPGLSFDNTTTRATLVYNNTSGGGGRRPKMPDLPAFNDTAAANKFSAGLRGLTSGPFWGGVPRDVDYNMFVTVGLGLVRCGSGNATCGGTFGERFAASMNNVSFQFPTNSGSSMLQAYFFKRTGVYTTDFPNNPPVAFDYTNTSLSFDRSLIMTKKSTAVKAVRFNSTVQVVMQNTALLTVENHPIHLHGFNFHVVGQGSGIYDPNSDPKGFNLVDPQERNTVGVPVGGWAAIRFRANNPGVWLIHCHLDTHLPWGLATAFVVEGGNTTDTKLPAPPADLPSC